MIFTLTDRHYNVLDAYETDDYLIGQYIGSILETLEINVLVKSLNAEHWVEGNYIMCQDKRGKKRWFTIYDCDDSHGGDVKSLFCYSGTIDIVAEDAAPISAPEAKPFKWYFDQIFYDTGIVLGINEISDLTRKLEFTSENASNAEMLQYVLNGFDNAEASLDVEFDGATPTKLVLNVYKRIGNEEPQAILSDEDDSLTSLERKGSISDLATCINPTGAEDENGNPITLLGKYYEERDEQGNILYYSPVDSPRVFSVVARRDFYVQLPGKANGEFDGYINRRYESQATTQDALWQESLAQLKKIDHVAVTYEANGYIDCSIGDNVQIVSHEMKPPVMIAARTIEYKFNDDDPSRNVYKFGNYVELTSNLDELSKIVSDLKQKLLIVTVVASAGTVFKNGTGETDLTAVTILGGKEVDTDGLFYNYVWAKYDKNGNFVGATSGKSITVYARNIDEKETYIVTVENEGAKSIGQITVTNVNDGAQGIQGPPGADGRTPYLHIAYANSADGRTDFSTTDSANKLYIGQYTDFTQADSTDPTKYSWTLIKGDKGEPGYTPIKGVDYFDGKDGQDGKSSYLWVKYSVNANGNPMTDNPAGALYIGVATTTTPTAPTSYTAYKWSLIKGADGIPGEKGQDGRTSYLHVKYSNDGGKTFTANNGETVGAWMGTYVDFTQADSTNPADYTWNKVKGEQGPQGVQGPPGADGKSLYTWVKYADDINGNGMSDYPDGKKYIGLAYNKTTPTESTNPADYTWALIQGPQGVKGTDGQTYYTWIKYADSPTSGMSDDPTGKKYMGIAYNKTTPNESTNYADYSWSLIQGPQGPKGDQGPQGPQGVQGPKGADGQTLYTWIKYADSPTSGMSDTPDGKKYIGLAYNKTTPTESSNYADYQWSLIQGPQGVQGPKGADGVTTYTWVKYADDDKGTGMSDSPNGKRYLGLAYNKTTPTESTNPADYSWSPLYDNVQVGGRNLIINSTTRRVVPSGTGTIINHEDDVVVEEWNTSSAKRAHGVGGSSISFAVFSANRKDTNTTKSGQKYVHSIYIKNNSNNILNVSNNIGNFEQVPPGVAKRVIIHGVGNGIQYLQFVFSTTKAGESFDFTYWQPQIEEGNVATDWTPAPEDVEAAIDQAKRDAQNAQSTADGKNTVFYQATAPSTVGRKINDLWYDTDDGYKPYRFDGSIWVAAPFGNAAIANLDAGKITTGYLNAARIAAKSIDVSKLNVSTLSAITANLGNITAGNISGVNITGVTITGSTIISDGVWQTTQSRVQLGNGVITVGDSSANNTVSPVGFIVEQDGGRLHHEFGADGILFYGSASDIFKAGIYVQYEPYGNGISMVLAAENYTAVTSKFWVRNNEARFQSTENFIDPEPNVKKAIKVSGGIATDGLYANTGSISKNAIATNGKIYVGGEGIELSWVGGTPYIDFLRRAGVDFDMRLILETDSGLAIRSSDNIVRHKFYANGTKSGGTIEIDGKILGMSPIDSPQILIETIEFDVPLTETGTKVLLDTRFAKAVNHKFAVFPNHGEVIEKGADYFIIAGTGTADIRIVGERVGYAGVYFDDMEVA